MLHRFRGLGWLSLVSALLLLVPVARAAVDAPATGTVKTYELVGVGHLRLELPEGWHDKLTRSVLLGVPTDDFLLTPADTNAYAVTVSILQLTEEQVKKVDCRQELTRGSKIELAGAEEKTLPLMDIEGTTFAGAYFTLTDKSVTPGTAKPGEYRWLTQGFAKSGSLVMTFRLTSNVGGEAERNQLLNLVKTARIEPKQ